MDSLLRPVGRASARVYWRRRAVVVAAVLLASYGAVKTCAPDPSAGDAARSSQTGSSEQAAGTPSPSGPATTDQDDPANQDTPEREAPSQTPTGTASNEEVSGGGGGVQPGYCRENNLRVDVRPDKRQYGPADEPLFTLLVVNVGDAPCKFDIGSAAWSLEIMTGEARVWSSADCAIDPVNDVQTLNRLSPVSIEVSWDRRHSSEECPVGEQSVAAAGTYTITAGAGEIISPRTVFLIEG